MLIVSSETHVEVWLAPNMSLNNNADIFSKPHTEELFSLTSEELHIHNETILIMLHAALVRLLSLRARNSCAWLLELVNT
jgi:hypothetical protein